MLKNFQLTIIASLSLFPSLPVIAAPCTVVNHSLVSQVTGDCIAQRPHDDAVVLQYTGNGDMYVENDIQAGNGFSSIWHDMTIQGTGTAQSALDIQSISSSTYQPDGYRKTITTAKLTLDNVDLEANVSFHFNEPNNELNFNNSRIYFHTRDPIFQAGTNLTINSLTGDNQWKGVGKLDVPAMTTLNVNAGSTFEFYAAGKTGYTKDRLAFTAGAEVNVDDATLRFKESGIDFGKSSIFNVTNNGVLNFHASGTQISAGTVNLDTASVQFDGGDIAFDVEVSNIHNSAIGVSSSGRYISKQMIFSGTNNTLSGGRSTDYIETELIKTKDTNATEIDIDSLNQLRVETLLLSSNLTINLDHAALKMGTGSDIHFQGGTINLNDRGQLNIFGAIVGNDLTINVNGGGLFIGQQSTLELGGNSHITLSSNSSSIDVSGKLTGSGIIQGSGGIIRFIGDERYADQGILSPGTTTSPFGTIEASHNIVFETSLGQVTDPDLLASGLFDGGHYDVDIGLNNGAVQNDKLIYGNGDVDLSKLKSLRVNVADNSTAAQLHRKSFRVIEAKDSSVTGTIEYRKQNLDIEEGANVPVLIDFIPFDDLTHGKADLTLYAEERLPVVLCLSFPGP